MVLKTKEGEQCHDAHIVCSDKEQCQGQRVLPRMTDRPDDEGNNDEDDQISNEALVRCQCLF